MNKNITHKRPSKWNDDKVIEDLKKIIGEIGHFPSRTELKTMGVVGLSGAMNTRGGVSKFRKIFNEEIFQLPKGYWTYETTIERLNNVITKLGHFPTSTELYIIKQSGLNNAIIQYGSFNKFRKLLGYEPLHKPKYYWDDGTIIKSLKKVEIEIGHFPTGRELEAKKYSDLNNAISRNGGINKFRLLFGEKLSHRPIGFWTDEILIEKLKEIKSKMGYFPTYTELKTSTYNGLISAISIHGGINKFRELLGETPYFYQKYRSELASYNTRRGKNTENLIKSISQDYCHQNGFPEPKYNVKLSKGHILEIICDVGKTIGIDVTNTTIKYMVSKKWTHKSYHLYLDELWIVVFSNVFTPDDYLKWNQESPENVKVFSVYGFLEELDYSLDTQMKNKIDKYCSCTFHTKEELKNK